MAREIEKHEQIIEAFRDVDIVSELVEKLPNGEFRNELDMDIILFGRSYRGKQVGPYTRLLEFAPGDIIVQENSWESSIFYILVSGQLDASVSEPNGNRKKVGEILPGSSFGEMALLSGTPRTASVSVSGNIPARVLEFTRPAIRLLRKLPKFGRALDRNYRNYGLTLTLNEIKDFTHLDLDRDLLGRLNDAARFAVYEKDHVLFREGDPVNRVVFVRNGWIQRVSGLEFNPKAADMLIETDESVGLDFLGAGTCLGIDAVDKPGDWKYTATVRGRTEVIEVAISRLREDQALSGAIMPFLKTSAGKSDIPSHPQDTRVITAASREIETGVVDGVNLLVMDMAKCIRCGNCSLACHKVHGNSRLVRRGIHIERPVKANAWNLQSVLAPSVCMHCQDPECLTGCPTGAIARFPDGEIDINPKTCIGCGDCATQCPYNAISMIAKPDPKIKSGKGIVSKTLSAFSLSRATLPEPVTQTESLLAVKCNLCKDTGLNKPGTKTSKYSCEENCPTGALVRVNPREYFGEVNETLGLIQRSKTHAIGVNIHKFDLRSVLWHIFGVLMVLIGGGAAIWATQKFTQDLALSPDTWLTMRWITGLVGLAGIVWVMAYPARKQVYRRRAGALRYWMLSHVYLGVFAGVLLLVHGGSNSGGLLTTFLMITFDLVIATGIFGAACYFIVPRFMTRIEREPLLIEDLQARREELRAELVRSTDATTNPDLKSLIQRKVRRRFLGLRYLLRQYLKQEDLQSMLAEAREEFRDATSGMSRADDSRLIDAVENAATLRRVDALLLLHKLLKIWVAPHVLFTSIMLALMLIHIAQVVYFNVR
ncbi:MAG TPA: cyclic nucleotide-binding domain-containing protein [Pyrinomonadaceae bacterium]|nr:cyclic nucleotide-binding domain-containing protein [Acidobacteriota bacterium]HQZ95578.1 cyclic nucleotide-binding domain-containing protein [Pyrinomonadaceae bacterium]